MTAAIKAAGIHRYTAKNPANLSAAAVGLTEAGHSARSASP